MKLPAEACWDMPPPTVRARGCSANGLAGQPEDHVRGVLCHYRPALAAVTAAGCRG
jgi:hypothetical protein